MEEETIEPGSSGGSKKRRKRAANATHVPANLENQIIPLLNDDIAFQTKLNQYQKELIEDILNLLKRKELYILGVHGKSEASLLRDH
jgi:superfamily II DNA or RNA helicase